MKPGRQELIKILRGDELVSLYVRVSEFTISGELIKLASFQNIHPELEERESEAWQKLIKVLTHEIINSVGPIKLASSTLLNTLKNPAQKARQQLSSVDIDNMYSGLKAIYNRSLGLSKFVEDYKTITEIPKPDFKEVRISELIDEILTLLKNDILVDKIEVNVSVNPRDLRVYMDKKMIAQVLINLIRNAVHSLENHLNPKIIISAEQGNDRILIAVEDNGCGIPFNILDYIFMPFFSTKQNGSGIGLTLSRQIMRLHKGLINVVSKEGEGTRVILIF